MSTDCEVLLKKFLVLNPSKRANLETIMKDKWMNMGYEDDELKPYVEPLPDLKDQKRIGKTGTVCSTNYSTCTPLLWRVVVVVLVVVCHFSFCCCCSFFRALSSFVVFFISKRSLDSFNGDVKFNLFYIRFLSCFKFFKTFVYNKCVPFG